MAWCPKCKYEYTPGVTTCPDCKVDLVESLEAFSTNEFIIPEGISDTDDECKNDNYRQDEDFDGLTEEELKALSAQKHEYVKAYVKSSTKKEDMKSSSVSFLIVGILLFIFAALIYFQIIPFGAEEQKLFYTVIIGFFGIVFLVVSWFSIKRAKLLTSSAQREERLTEEIVQYCLNNYTEPNTSEITEEEIYFVRESSMRELISKEYKGLDESYIDYLLEIIYSKTYPND